MSYFRGQVTLQPVSAVTEDRIVNTWHFEAPEVTDGLPSAASQAAMSATLIAFYNDIQGLMPDSKVALGTHRVDWYRLADVSPRIPRWGADFTLTGLSTSDSFPTEVAMCASYQAARISGVNQASRRGRVFIGPLTEATSSGARPTGAARTTINAAMEAVALDSNGALGYTWVVYSQKLGTGATVTNGWCDNAYDTQRRRGQDPTVRDTWEQSA